MYITTTTLGSFPKPFYTPVPHWFDTLGSDTFLNHYQRYEQAHRHDPLRTERLITRATREIIRAQESSFIDVLTDGEVRRDDYIYAFCRGLEGITFSRRERRLMRAGTWEAAVPVIEHALSWQRSIFVDDFLLASSLTERPVKVTLPGPLTTVDTLYNEAYGSSRDACDALSRALRKEIEALISAGCRHIQIDDPVCMRCPDDAIEYGLPLLDRTLSHLPDDVEITIHLCCGYPDVLDNPSFPRASESTYVSLAPHLDRLPCAIIAVEDARCRNDLSLLNHFRDKRVALGVVSVTSTRVESAEEIVMRAREALRYLPPERLVLAPDCGMGMLPWNVARDKLCALGMAARSLHHDKIG